MKKKLIIIIFIFLLNVSFSYAAVEINEIMYNPEGSDTNREWIEIYNNSLDSIDIGSWYFFENETYHGLYPEGFSLLKTKERALIVKDIATAQSELGSNLKYIKSSFSLNNTGERLTIADVNKNQIDSYMYQSEDGANGDGQSLQKIDSVWKAGTPTPGEVNTSTTQITEKITSSLSTSSGDTINNDEIKINYLKPYYIASVDIPNNIITQSNFTFKAEVTYIKKNKKTKELDGYYYINFGDGNTLESDERIEAKYSYRSPGNYIFVFEYYHSKFSFIHGEEPDAFLKREISVSPHNLEILDVNSFDGVVIKNNTQLMVDMSSWKIIWNNYKYTFPRYSYISSGESIKIPLRTLGFSPYVNKWNVLQILSDTYKPISYFPKEKKYILKTKTEKETIINKNEQEIDFNTSYENDNFFGASDSYLGQYLYNNPNKSKVDFGEEKSTFSENKKNLSQDRNTNNNLLYYTLGVFILMLSFTRFFKYKNQKKKLNDFGSIEIIE